MASFSARLSVLATLLGLLYVQHGKLLALKVSRKAFGVFVLTHRCAMNSILTISGRDKLVFSQQMKICDVRTAVVWLYFAVGTSATADVDECALLCAWPSSPSLVIIYICGYYSIFVSIWEPETCGRP